MDLPVQSSHRLTHSCVTHDVFLAALS
jgi:hypothetical protein